jgi:hypothetical protein
VIAQYEFFAAYHILHVCYYIRLRTEALMATKFQNVETDTPLKPEEEKTEGILMHLHHSYAILSSSCQILSRHLHRYVKIYIQISVVH